MQIAASGAEAVTGSWRVDDFTLARHGRRRRYRHRQQQCRFHLEQRRQSLNLRGGTAIHGTGSEFANVITGNSAANVLDGAGGADRVNGGGGDDVLVYDALDELLDGGSGSDTLRVDGSGVTLDLR